MSKVRVEGISMSLDGYAAGPSQSEADPLGINGRRLHDWMARKRAAASGKAPDDETAVDSSVAIGATIMGRNTFGPIRGPWENFDWQGWWGDDPPFHHPIFVLTHHARPSFDTEGGTSFHFVTEGIHAALEQARAVAGAKDVSLMGAETIHQYLSGGLIDEIWIIVVPILLGGGARLFSEPDYPIDWKVESIDTSDDVMHVRLSRAPS